MLDNSFYDYKKRVSTRTDVYTMHGRLGNMGVTNECITMAIGRCKYNGWIAERSGCKVNHLACTLWLEKEREKGDN